MPIPQQNAPLEDKLSGRPSSYSADIAQKICERLASGESVRTICASGEMPSESTVFLWLLKHDSFSEQYARARKSRADARVERIDQVIQDMRTGAIDYNQARVEIDAIKWQSGKENSERYGDKVRNELTDPNGGPATLNVVIRSVLDPK